MNELDTALAAMLEKDDGVQRLVMGLSLSDRFHFYLLACDIPRAATAILDILQNRVPHERDEPIRFVVLDPYRAHTKILEPIPFDMLVKEVLVRLVSPAAEERAQDVVFVVDASRAVAQDEPAWLLLFQRMNEDRNTISSVLGGPLLLVLPEWLEPVFAHAAPDFWSIRSSAVLVRVPREILRTEMSPEPLRLPEWSSELAMQGEDDGATLEEIEREIAALQKRLEEHPDDAAVEQSLMIWLGRRLRHEGDAGSIEQWLDTSENIVRKALLRLDRHSDELSTWTLVLQLVHEMAKAARRGGYPERSRRLYEEGVTVARRAGELHPENEELHAMRWLLLVGLAHESGLQNQWLTVLQLCNEARDIALEFHGRRPDRATWPYCLAVVLNRIGAAWLKFNNIEQMLDVQEEAVFYSEQAHALEPRSFEVTQELCTSHFGKGEAYRQMGALSLALDVYERGTMIAREWLMHEPKNVQSMNLVAMGLNQTAAVQTLLGYESRALETRIEAISLLRECVQRGPGEGSIRVPLALVLINQAETLEILGDLSTALAHFREAASVFEQVANTSGLPPVTQSTVERCHASITRLEAMLDNTP